jgi:hypothetical protein
MKLPMMMEGNFEPHFSVKHMLKDVVIATRLARGFGIEFGATDASRHGLTEELRQGRGDGDYSSLIRQYFPAGGPLQAGAQPTNGEDDQPRLAGIDEGKTAESEPVAETKPVSEDSPGVSTETASETKTEVAGHATSAAEQIAPLADVSSAKDEGSETKAEPVSAPASSSSEQGSDEKKSGASLLSFPKPEDEKEPEEPRGLWGGFWRRHPND